MARKSWLLGVIGIAAPLITVVTATPAHAEAVTLCMSSSRTITPYMTTFPRDWAWPFNTTHASDGPRTCGYQGRKNVYYKCTGVARGSRIDIIWGTNENIATGNTHRASYTVPNGACTGGWKTLPNLYASLPQTGVYHVHWHEEGRHWETAGLKIF